MNISKEDLEWAFSQGLLEDRQVSLLWNALKTHQSVRAKFDLEHVAYYLGALLIIVALTLYLGLSWENLSGFEILILSLLYGFGFGSGGWWLRVKLNNKVASGLLYTVAVCMTPLIVYGLERIAGFWPQGNFEAYFSQIRLNWLIMELATAGVGLGILQVIQFPFLLTPVSISLWFMSMDSTQLFFHKQNFSWHDRQVVSIWFGIAMLFVFYVLDRRTKEDYAFWGYLLGLISFWYGIWLLWDSAEGKAIFGLINFILIILSPILARRIFIVLGGFGLFILVNYLAYKLFQNILLFSSGLFLVGLAVIFLGVKYQRYQATIRLFVRRLVPENWHWLLPQERI